MSHTFRIPSQEESVLTILDVQERLVGAMPPAYLQGNVRRIAKLAIAARILDIPVIQTEQLPMKLGHTLPVVQSELPDGIQPIEKNEFDGLANPPFRNALDQAGRQAIILTGLEIHVGILQTALGLAESGRRPVVIEDACLCRHSVDFRSAIRSLMAAGVLVTTFETLLYSWIGSADSPAFKEIGNLASERDY